MDFQADLKAYYEEEARQRWRGPLKGRRLELRTSFLQMLGGEGRQSVVDFGCGPGGDAAGFIDAGFDYVGIDLAVGNARLAAEQEITVVPASIAAPPLRAGSFDVGWSMSTIMHIPEPGVGAAITAMASVLRPGSPFLIGLWGGTQGNHIDDTKQPGQRRLFSLRSPERNRELLAAAGTIERDEVWDAAGPDDWNYQVFQLRTF